MTLGALAELHRALVGVVDRPMLVEQRADARPVIVGDVAVLDDVADQRAGLGARRAAAGE